MLDIPFCDKTPPDIQPEPTLSQLEVVSSCPVASTLEAKADPHLTTAFCQELQTVIIFPRASSAHYLPVCQDVAWSALADPNKEATQRLVNQQVFSFPGIRKEFFNSQPAVALLHSRDSHPISCASPAVPQGAQHLPHVLLATGFPIQAW